MTNNNNHKIAVLGGGSFGTIIANMLAVNGHSTTLWMRSSEQLQAITASGENAAYLLGYKFDPTLNFSTDIQQALEGVDTVIFAIPSSSFRKVAKLVSPWVTSDTVLISAAKGIEAETFLLPSQILEQELPSCKVGVISGPNLAKEIANFEITATVIASEHDSLCDRVQEILASSYFRIYANHDRYGVELAEP